MDDLSKCPICLHIKSKVIRVHPCGHSFCSECISRCFHTQESSQKVCPFCRQIVKEANKDVELRNWIEAYVEWKGGEIVNEWKQRTQQMNEFKWTHITATTTTATSSTEERNIEVNINEFLSYLYG